MLPGWTGPSYSVTTADTVCIDVHHGNGTRDLLGTAARGG